MTSIVLAALASWGAAEASISFHQDKFNGGDTRVTQYPVQLSGMLFPIPNAPVQPYVLGGVGWYYTRIDNSGTLSLFGADFRYIFIDPKTEIQNRSGDADFCMVRFGRGLGF